jgi:chitinase
MKHGGSWNFDVAGTSASNIAVSWSIQEGLTGGAISDAGVYTAPAADGIYHVVATSKADPSKSATATVSVGNTGFTLTGSLANARFIWLIER